MLRLLAREEKEIAFKYHVHSSIWAFFKNVSSKRDTSEKINNFKALVHITELKREL